MPGERDRDGHHVRRGSGPPVPRYARGKIRNAVRREQEMTTREILEKARDAKAGLAGLGGEKRREALRAMARFVLADEEAILLANREDLANAENSIAPVMMDRLRLDPARLKAVAEGMVAVAELPDPVGRVLETRTLKSGLCLSKVSVPIGVIAMIYESRPNVTCDAAALCVMSGNVAVLRGGKEAIRTNLALAKAMKKGLAEAGLSPDVVGMIEDPSRESARELMEAVGFVDLLIPRGSASLINACVRGALVPCIQTGAGICHIYVDKSADQEMALRIVDNAKTSRPSVCNAAEVCLVDRAIAPEFLPKLYRRLNTDRAAAGKVPVTFRLDGEALALIPGEKAGEKDFDTEFLDYILAVKIVSGVEEAVDHIRAHSTSHSEAVVAEDPKVQERFVSDVDSSSVYVNASTRFTDGGEFGFGCEIGISTQKLHARGPMGLEALTGYKYILRGNGQTR
ncbi:MAG: glutamate-5-semialdehyde dehydrogenase [Clostridia bacterium]|nr:glutamate-5-semialdehyde dehydrogenase [Clostridia bacterium]